MGRTGDASGLTARLGRLVGGEHPPLSEAWRDLGERAFVDTVGVLLAGRSSPAVAILAETVLADQPEGPSRSVALGRPVPARAAALIDGTSAHALDYDDVDDALVGHPSAVLVPALLALGDQCDSSGEDLLAAFRVGLQTMRTVAGVLGIDAHYRRGWHATSTLGALGAAAASARLLELTAGAARHCLGLAATLAGGSRQNFGTMTKPLHAGLAADHGILAAQLAGRGFTADPDQLEGPMGFLALFGGNEPETGDASAGLNVKLYPCCYATHAAIDATLEVSAAVAVDDVTGIEVVVPPAALGPLIHSRPADGLQAKFSLEYAVAAALLDGAVTLASFDDGRVKRDDVQALLRTVRVTEARNPPGVAPEWRAPFAAVVTVELEGATPLTCRVDAPAGHATRPLTEEQLRSKFDDCLTSTGLQPLAGAAYEALRTLRRQPSARVVLDVLVETEGREWSRITDGTAAP